MNYQTPQFADAHLATGVRLRYAEQGDPNGHAIHWERPERVVADLKEFMAHSTEHKEVIHGKRP